MGTSESMESTFGLTLANAGRPLEPSTKAWIMAELAYTLWLDWAVAEATRRHGSGAAKFMVGLAQLGRNIAYGDPVPNPVSAAVQTYTRRRKRRTRDAQIALEIDLEVDRSKSAEHRDYEQTAFEFIGQKFHLSADQIRKIYYASPRYKNRKFPSLLK